MRCGFSVQNDKIWATFLSLQHKRTFFNHGNTLFSKKFRIPHRKFSTFLTISHTGAATKEDSVSQSRYSAHSDSLSSRRTSVHKENSTTYEWTRTSSRGIRAPNCIENECARELQNKPLAVKRSHFVGIVGVCCQNWQIRWRWSC